MYRHAASGPGVARELRTRKPGLPEQHRSDRYAQDFDQQPVGDQRER